MKTRLTATMTALILAASEAVAQTAAPTPRSGPFFYYSTAWPGGWKSPELSRSQDHLSFRCGNGSVFVSYETGKVTFTGDCTTDEAARAFWIAVEKVRPSGPK